MNLVISWSKAQSNVVATALHSWLPTVIPGIEPWISSKDIAKGREWFPELQGVLELVRLCIICITPENVRSPWIYYEAGVIAAKGKDVLIFPYLVGVSPTLLADGPLGQRQCTIANQEDTWKLIKSLNSHALGSRHNESLLEGNFKSRWPEFTIQIQPVAETEVDDEEGFVTTDVDSLAGGNLSAEARTIILAVSKDHDGVLTYMQDREPQTSFVANGANVCPDQSPRTVARWKAARDSLVTLKILQPQGKQDERYTRFTLTDKGYKIADALQGKSSLDDSQSPSA